jgi:hypothetical protein
MCVLDWKAFQEKVHTYIANDSARATSNLQAGPPAIDDAERTLTVQFYLKKCMLRRLKTSKILGEPIVVLPGKRVDLTILEFTPAERSIYDAIERAGQVLANEFLAAGKSDMRRLGKKHVADCAGKVLKRSMAIRAILTRLRQATNHPTISRLI